MSSLLCSIEVTEVCNQDCSYCYKYSKLFGVSDPSTKVAAAAIDMLSKFADWALLSKHHDSICFQFHGGEPLAQFDLIKLFVEACRTERKKPRPLIEFAVQSNCTLASDEKIDWLVRNKVSIGISFGGSRRAQDQYRPMKGGQPSYARAVSGVRRVLHASPNSTCILVVANPDLLVESVEECIELGFRSIAITPVHDEVSVSGDWQQKMADAHVEAVKVIADHNRKEKRPIIDQSTVAVLRALHSNSSGYMCQSWPCGAGSELLALSATGYLYPCDTLFGLEEWSYGHIDTIIKEGLSLEEIVGSKIGEPLRKRRPDTITHCKACHATASCGGGCPGVTYRMRQEVNSPSNHCHYSATFHTLVDRLTSEQPDSVLALARPSLLQ